MGYKGNTETTINTCNRCGLQYLMPFESSAIDLCDDCVTELSECDLCGFHVSDCTCLEDFGISKSKPRPNSGVVSLPNGETWKYELFCESCVLVNTKGCLCLTGATFQQIVPWKDTYQPPDISFDRTESKVVVYIKSAVAAIFTKV